MIERSRLTQGMHVKSAEGRDLGRVSDLGEHELVIEKGHFFPRDYVVRYDDVQSVDDHDVVHLSLGCDALRQGEGATAPADVAAPGLEAGGAERATEPMESDEPEGPLDDGTPVTVYEEEVFVIRAPRTPGAGARDSGERRADAEDDLPWPRQDPED